jgi:hypothetical protein
MPPDAGGDRVAVEDLIVEREAVDQIFEQRQENQRGECRRDHAHRQAEDDNCRHAEHDGRQCIEQGDRAAEKQAREMTRRHPRTHSFLPRRPADTQFRHVDVPRRTSAPPAR